MADEKPVTSGNAAVPPKANPLAHSVGTASFPKPGATATGLKPGLKLPARPAIRKPGSTVTGLRPGLKLPTKPGVPTAASPVPATPAAPAPAAASPSKTSAIENLKNVTQNLKSITAPLPQQAILHKTGIIGGAELSETQKMAAKSKTMRISLSEAKGSAAVSNDAAPMKTIRIKRPVGIGGAASAAPDAAPAAPADASSAAPSKTEATTAAAETPSTSVTQRKTLKITRPGVVRPAGKFVPKKTAAPATGGAAAAGGEGEVADIPDLPPSGSPGVAAPVPHVVDPNHEPDVGKGWALLNLLVQIAACAAVGFLCYLFNENIQQMPNWFLPE